MLSLSDDIRGTYMETLEAALTEAQASASRKHETAPYSVSKGREWWNYKVYSENS